MPGRLRIYANKRDSDSENRLVLWRMTNCATSCCCPTPAGLTILSVRRDGRSVGIDRRQCGHYGRQVHDVRVVEEPAVVRVPVSCTANTTSLSPAVAAATEHLLDAEGKVPGSETSSRERQPS
jgi:hypothetical protein